MINCRIPSEKWVLIRCGDLNCRIGKLAKGYEGVHGGNGYGLRNKEVEHILEFAVAHNLVVGNSYFTKKDNHLITYQSGSVNSLTDYILVRRSDFKLVRDIKVIPGKQVVTQRQMLVSDIEWKFTKQNKKSFAPKLCAWKLKDQDVVHKFQDELNNLLESDANSIKDYWKHLKINLLKATEMSCGLSKNRKWHQQTCLWDISVNVAVKKKETVEYMKNGGSKEDYALAKKVPKRRVFAAKKKTEKEKMKDIETDAHIYRIGKQIKQESKDIAGEKRIQDNNGVLAFNEEEKNKAWKQHCERLLNVKFPWRIEDLSTADPVLRSSLLITKEMVAKSICKIKNVKASGLSGVGDRNVESIY